MTEQPRCSQSETHTQRTGESVLQTPKTPAPQKLKHVGTDTVDSDVSMLMSQPTSKPLMSVVLCPPKTRQRKRTDSVSILASPNSVSLKRKTKSTMQASTEIDFATEMCTTCMTYAVVDHRTLQCGVCLKENLGLPLCFNCDTRLTMAEYSAWLKSKRCQRYKKYFETELEIELRNMSDMNSYENDCQIFCKACFDNLFDLIY